MIGEYFIVQTMTPAPPVTDFEFKTRQIKEDGYTSPTPCCRLAAETPVLIHLLQRGQHMRVIGSV